MSNSRREWHQQRAILGGHKTNHQVDPLRLEGAHYSRTSVPPAKGRKHGAKAGRRKGGGRGGRHK